MIATQSKSTETLSRLLRREFDSFTNFWQADEAKNIIQTAKDYGLKDLAIQMEKDLTI